MADAASAPQQPVQLLYPSADDARLVVTFFFEDDGEDWRCARVEVRPWELGRQESLDPADLGRINLRRLERRARAGIFGTRMAERLMVIASREKLGEPIDRKSFPSLRQDGRPHAPRRGRPPAHDEGYYMEIGTIYNAAKKEGEPPLRAVAEAKGIAVSTAAKHVRRARQLGFAVAAQSDGGVVQRRKNAEEGLI